MPSYSFICNQCGALFERKLSLSACASMPEIRCPHCGFRSPERVYEGTFIARTSPAWNTDETERKLKKALAEQAEAKHCMHGPGCSCSYHSR